MATANSTPWRRIGCLAVVAVSLLLGYAAFLAVSPYDEVEITIRGIPSETNLLCIVADRKQGIEVMRWSLHKVGPFTMHPARCVVSERDPDDNTHRAMVRWINSDRIGVLQRTKNGKWLLSWFALAKSRLEGSTWLFGGGRWEVDLNEADEVQSVSAETVQALGFIDAFTHE